MKDNHIIEILENHSFDSLDQAELAAIHAHADACGDCRQAFEAAYISASLLKDRAAEVLEPSPFFQTRVLAILRERQSGNETWAWGRMWQSARVLISLMAATVAMLAVLSFVLPGADPSKDSNVVSVTNNYSTDEVIFGQLPSEDQISDGQILTTLYEAEGDTVK